MLVMLVFASASHAKVTKYIICRGIAGKASRMEMNVRICVC